MTKNRWNPYVFFDNSETIKFWSTHFCSKNKKLLFIMGKGFDVRMNVTIIELMRACPNINIECHLIQFNEGKSSSSHKLKPLVDENMSELNKVLSSDKIKIKNISLWEGSGRKRKRVGDRKAADIIGNNIDDLKDFTDIIVDISALPRGVYFSFVGKILTLLDIYKSIYNPNFFISVAENPKIDELTKETEIDGELNYLRGFMGEQELTAQFEKPVIWFPILGEDKKEHLKKAFDHIFQVNTSAYEICPVLPFPSKDPGRSDSLMIDYHQLLFEEFNIEAQNIMYVPEQNPFEAYIRLNNAIRNYNKSLTTLTGCKAVISTFSSKLLSIGTLLSAYELKGEIGVGVLNVDSGGYEIDNVDDIKKLKNESKLFLSWLTGDPYKI